MTLTTVYSDRHRAHTPGFDIVGGRVSLSASPPRNTEIILAALARDIGGPVIGPTDHGLDPILALHDAGYVRFLETAWARWLAVHGDTGDALPSGSRVLGTAPRVPEGIDALMSYYAGDNTTPITAGTWQAAYWSAQVAVTAAELVASGRHRRAYSAQRPGGHHAGRDYFAGYCYLAVEAMACERLRAGGAQRVAYLDVDYHHCNGTQQIFYQRGDVLCVSIHCDPRFDYPYFSGYADETGEGPGEGATVNLPLPPGTGWAQWSEALAVALARIEAWGADALVLFLGVDTYHKDSISQFRLDVEHFPMMGERIAGLGLPTVIVKGGGYSEEALDLCVTAFLRGFLERHGG